MLAIVKNSDYYYVYFTLLYMKKKSKNEAGRKKKAAITSILKNFDNVFDTIKINIDLQNISHDQLVLELNNVISRYRTI